MPSLRPSSTAQVIEAFDAAGNSLGLFAEDPRGGTVGFNPYRKADDATVTNAATTGFSITLSAQTRYYLLKPAGTLATGTFTFPAATDLVDGQEITIGSTQVQTAMTLTAGSGTTINNAATTLAAAGNFVKYKYVAADTAWYRVG